MGDRIVLDIETQKEFAEVEGRKPELLGVSVIGIYSYNDNRYDVFLENEIDRLAPKLQSAEMLIGFNIRKFDMPVLQPYIKFPLAPLPMLDILEEITKALGHRLSLDSVAQATLGRGKSGHGLDALRWFKQGRFDLIARYCLDDVKLTKEVYEYGKANHRLFGTGRHSGDKLTIPVFWPERKRPLEAIQKMLREAHEKQLQVEIEYLSQSAEVSETGRVRRVDVYHIQEPHFEGHCHFRKEVRQFRIDRILDIRPTWIRYTVPADFTSAPLTE